MQIETKYKPSACTSVDRQDLSEPYYQPDHNRLLASNGYMIVVIPVTKEEGDRETYVRGDAIDAARDAADGGERASIKIGKTSLATSDGRTYPIAPTDENFLPNLDSVLNSGPKGRSFTFALDARKLHSVAEALGAGSDVVRITINPKDQDAPIRVDLDGSEAYGILMPCRPRGHVGAA